MPEAGVEGRRKTRSWTWFAAWVVVGAGYAFGLIEGLIGLPFLLFAIIGTVFLARRLSSMRGVAGVCSGLGLIPPIHLFHQPQRPGGHLLPNDSREQLRI